MERPIFERRPMGVSALSILAAIAGVLYLLAGLGMLLIGGAVDDVVAILGIVAIVFGAGYLFFMYGAWQLRPWAWTVGVALAVGSIVWYVLELFDGYDIVSVVVGIAIAAVILWYLQTPRVREAFGRGATTTDQTA